MIKPQDINLKELEDKRFPKVHNIMVVEDKIKQFLSDKLNRIEKKAFCRYCGKSVNEESSDCITNKVLSDSKKWLDYKRNSPVVKL